MVTGVYLSLCLRGCLDTTAFPFCSSLLVTSQASMVNFPPSSLIMACFATTLYKENKNFIFFWTLQPKRKILTLAYKVDTFFFLRFDHYIDLALSTRWQHRKLYYGIHARIHMYNFTSNRVITFNTGIHMYVFLILLVCVNDFLAENFSTIHVLHKFEHALNSL